MHRRVAQMLGVVMALAVGHAVAQQMPNADAPLRLPMAHITAVLFADCGAMEEPLERAGRKCTEAIQAGGLTEAQIGEALFYRGVIAFRQEMYDEAMRDLNMSIQYAPEVGRTYYLKGLAYEAMGEDRRANGQYRNAFLYAPEDADVIGPLMITNYIESDPSKSPVSRRFSHLNQVDIKRVDHILEVSLADFSWIGGLKGHKQWIKTSNLLN